MTLSTWNATAIIGASDAAFRTEISAVDTAIRAVGWVQTSDTGQINFSTVTRPGATSTAAGYAVYKMNDSLQATYPVFMKVEFGTSDFSTGAIGFWVTVGTSTDGAGTLGTIKSARVFIRCGGSSGGTWPSFVSGSTSRLVVAYAPTAGSTYALFWGVERLQSTAGADTSDGLVFYWGVRSASSGQQVLTFSGTQPAALAELGTMMPFSSTAWANGANIYTGPVFPVGWSVFPPVQNVLTYFNGDLTAANPVTISVYGQNRSFYPVGSANQSGFGVNSSTTILLRHD